jgi:phosphoglycerol transferase MdoB-like AlkP superfamily enzyme
LEGFAILLAFVLIPVTAVVLLLSVLALAFHRPLGRAIRRSPRMARRMHLVVPVTVFCVVLFLLFAGACMRGTYEQYLLNEPLCTRRARVTLPRSKGCWSEAHPPMPRV